jgi:nicotinamidase-related amidase
MENSPHFKPDQCALLLIDHQVGTIQLIKNITSDQSIRNAVTLAKAALAFGMPIVMTSSQEDHVQGPLHPSLERTAPDAFARRVQRQGVVNAWDDAKFSKAVADTGRKQLIIAAVTTDICLVFPTISAVEAGYEVQAVLDASGSSFAIGAHTLAGCGHFMTEERPQFVIDQILKLSARVAGRSEPQEIAL